MNYEALDEALEYIEAVDEGWNDIDSKTKVIAGILLTAIAAVAAKIGYDKIQANHIVNEEFQKNSKTLADSLSKNVKSDLGEFAKYYIPNDLSKKEFHLDKYEGKKIVYFKVGQLDCVKLFKDVTGKTFEEYADEYCKSQGRKFAEDYADLPEHPKKYMDGIRKFRAAISNAKKKVNKGNIRVYSSHDEFAPEDSKDEYLLAAKKYQSWAEGTLDISVMITIPKKEKK